jgi:hypothetical protein
MTFLFDEAHYIVLISISHLTYLSINIRDRGNQDLVHRHIFHSLWSCIGSVHSDFSKMIHLFDRRSLRRRLHEDQKLKILER